MYFWNSDATKIITFKIRIDIRAFFTSNLEYFIAIYSHRPIYAWHLGLQHILLIYLYVRVDWLQLASPLLSPRTKNVIFVQKGFIAIFLRPWSVDQVDFSTANNPAVKTWCKMVLRNFFNIDRKMQQQSWRLRIFLKPPGSCTSTAVAAPYF